MTNQQAYQGQQDKKTPCDVTAMEPDISPVYVCFLFREGAIISYGHCGDRLGVYVQILLCFDT